MPRNLNGPAVIRMVFDDDIASSIWFATSVFFKRLTLTGDPAS